MKHRRQPEYRDLWLAIALLTGVLALTMGLTATRLGWISIEVKIALGPRAPLHRTVTAATPPAPAANPAARVVVPAVRRVAEAPASLPTGAPMLVKTAEAATIVTAMPATPYTDKALAMPNPGSTTLAMTETPTPGIKPRVNGRRRALASASVAPARSECVVTGPANVDPTAGELVGATGLPDHVMYFKHRNPSGCRAVTPAGATTARAK